MDITLISPPYFKSVHPDRDCTGSIEQQCWLLAKALAKRGHKVTLFATGDVIVPQGVELKFFFKRAIDKDSYYHKDQVRLTHRGEIHASKAMKNNPNSFFINYTIGAIPVLELLSGYNRNFFSVIWWPLDDFRLKPNIERFKEHPLVTVSSHQISGLFENKVVGTCPPGIDKNVWIKGVIRGKFLLFVGKLIPEKGPDLAIKIALKTGKQLILAGRRIESRYPGYFKTKIEPFLGEQIKYVGEVTNSEKTRLFSEAEAFLAIGRWPEPFGIVVLESQASGTPVIVWNKNGNIDSVIEGKTGYSIKANTDGEAVKMGSRLLNNISKIDLEECKRMTLKKYDIDAVARKYEVLIDKQISSSNHVENSYRGIWM